MCVYFRGFFGKHITPFAIASRNATAASQQTWRTPRATSKETATAADAWPAGDVETVR